MAIDDQQIEIAIVIKIEEPHSPADVWFRECRQSGRHSDLVEWHVPAVLVKRMILRIEVCDDKLRSAVTIDVAGVDTHASARDTIRIERNLGFKCGIDEG